MEEPKESGKSPGDWFYVLAASAVFLALDRYVFSTPLAEMTLINPSLLLIALFVAAFLLESRYVAYTGLLPNALIASCIFEYEWSTVPAALRLYAHTGLAMATASFILYYKKSRRGPLYNATYLLYSLKTLFPIYLSYYVWGSFSHPYFAYSFVLFALATWVFYMEAGI